MVYSHMPGRPFTAKAMEPLYICGTVDEPVYRQVRQRLWEFWFVRNPVIPNLRAGKPTTVCAGFAKPIFEYY